MPEQNAPASKFPPSLYPRDITGLPFQIVTEEPRELFTPSWDFRAALKGVMMRRKSREMPDYQDGNMEMLDGKDANGKRQWVDVPDYNEADIDGNGPWQRPKLDVNEAVERRANGWAKTKSKLEPSYVYEIALADPLDITIKKGTPKEQSLVGVVNAEVWLSRKMERMLREAIQFLKDSAPDRDPLTARFVLLHEPEKPKTERNSLKFHSWGAERAKSLNSGEASESETQDTDHSEDLNVSEIPF
jgi:hypothetical protein